MMKECFCGCGRTIPRLPLGLRSRNKRGAIVRSDVERVERLLRESRINSPTAERFVHEGRELMTMIADAIHARQDPGPEIEASSRDFMRRGRKQFSEAGIGGAARRAGMNLDEAVDAMVRGDWDPFA